MRILREWRQSNTGFTLIELMIVVAVISILAGIAYPSYLDQVQKTRRSEAKAALTDAASRQEQFFLDNLTYTAVIGDLGMSATTENNYYTLSIVSTATTYTVTATANGTQTNDTNCATLSISDTGSRTSENSSSAVTTDCW